MRIEIGLDKETRALLSRFLNVFEQMEVTLMDVLTQLEAEVGANTKASDSAVTLINNIVSTVSAADPNNARIKAVLDTLQANDVRLATLVVANTPVALPGPIPPPAPASPLSPKAG